MFPETGVSTMISAKKPRLAEGAACTTWRQQRLLHCTVEVLRAGLYTMAISWSLSPKTPSGGWAGGQHARHRAAACRCAGAGGGDSACGSIRCSSTMSHT